MKPVALFGIGTLLAVSLAAQNGPLNRPPAGFTALFNGKDLSGWRGRPGTYSPHEEAKLSKEELAAKQTQWNGERDLHWKVDTAKGEIVSDGQSVHLARSEERRVGKEC